MIMNLYRRIDKNKIQFDFMVHSNGKGYFDDEIKKLGGKIFRIEKFYVFNTISYYFKWKKFLLDHSEYQVIHGHIGSSAIVYLQVAKMLGRRTIVHSHSALPDKFDLHSRIISLLNYPNRHIATVVLAASERAGSDRYGKKVLKQENFHVFNNAIDTQNFMYSAIRRNEIRSKLGISEEALVIGNVGRLVEEKNQTRLINIFNELVKLVPTAHLVVVGEGQLRPNLEHLIKHLGLNRNVHLVGSKKNVADYLSSMDMFVFPSVNEGLGISLIEAQCTGLFCIASDSVPKEAKVSPIIVFQSLSDSDVEWVNTILANQSQKYVVNRKSKMAYVKKAGYDIQQTVPLISRIYNDLYWR